jgi:hypothetical protein
MTEPTLPKTAQVRVLTDLSTAVIAHFGDAVVTRLGPSRFDWRDEVDLEIFPLHTSAPSACLSADDVNITLIAETSGGSYTEVHRLDETVFAWALERLILLGEAGMELWADRLSARSGGLTVSRLAGDPFPEVSDNHRSRLSLSQTTVPWTDPARFLVTDPIEHSTHGFFLVDERLPQPIIDAAIAVRRQFADAVSIVTRPGHIGTDLIEVMPHATDASYLTIAVDDRGFIATSTGSSQRANSEFTTITDADPTEWILAVGRHGLLESELTRGFISRDVNGPATPEAIAAANRARRVSIGKVWKPWRPSARADVTPAG